MQDPVRLRWSRRKKIVVSVLASVVLVAGAIILLQPETTVNGAEFDAGQGPPGVADFSSTIPVIVLRTYRRMTISNSKAYTPFTMEIYEPKANAPARRADGPTTTVQTGVRIRGMVSRLFPKQSYRLKLQDEKGLGHAQPLLGMPSDTDWVLQGPWLDKSLIRNAFSYDLARAMGAMGMRTRVCEVFISTSGQPIRDSDYVGVYQLTEPIERGDDRVKLTALAPADNTEPAITGGYLLAWDVGDGVYLKRWNEVQVKYPDPATPAQMDWIDQALTRFDAALKGPDSRDPVKGYAAHIDMDAWVNYILFEELIFNLDGYVRSFYLVMDRGGKIRPGPVWDHDLALGHEFPPSTSFDQWWFIGRGAPHGWVPKLMQDPAFVKKMSTRWAALRKDVLRDAAIDTRIDTFAEPLLKGAADRNFVRWKILDVQAPFTMRPYVTIATKTYPEQITALKQFLHERAAWMDAHLKQ